MIMSIATKFETFNKNISISSDDIEIIADRYHKIVKRLNADFWSIDNENSHGLYVWSYWRDTAIHVSDIDMIFQLPYEYYEQYNNYEWNWQSALLQAVKESIEKTYTYTHLKADWQVIVIPRTDWIVFEVVPCFLNADWTYIFPNSNNWGSRKVTNPKPEISAIREMNKECNYNLKRLCRMIRAWRDNVDLKMWWLLIDTFAYNFLSKWEHRDKSYLYYDRMVRDFFLYLKDRDESQTYRLAPGSNQYVYKKDNFIYKAKTAYNTILEAIEAEEKEYEYTANQKWRSVFWSKF